MTVGLTLVSLALTVGMCILSATCRGSSGSPRRSGPRFSDADRKHHAGGSCRSESIIFFGEDDFAQSGWLFQNCLDDRRRGQLTAMTGPSGSGKDDAPTLIGRALASQDGEIDGFAHSRAGRVEAELVETRRHIGFIFQMHNLFDALSHTKREDAMHLGGCPSAEMRGARNRGPWSVWASATDRLSPQGALRGQRQRVAHRARIGVNSPEAHPRPTEPTAALDKDFSSRIVVSVLKELAVEDGSTPSYIGDAPTNRILDVADRIV